MLRVGVPTRFSLAADGKPHRVEWDWVLSQGFGLRAVLQAQKSDGLLLCGMAFLLVPTGDPIFLSFSRVFNKEQWEEMVDRFEKKLTAHSIKLLRKVSDQVPLEYRELLGKVNDEWDLQDDDLPCGPISQRREK